MPRDLWLADTNILLRWVQPHDPDHHLARQAIQRLEDISAIVCYTSQNLAEFWNVLTRPANRNGYGFTPSEADFRARIIEGEFRLLPDSLAVHEKWRSLLVAHSISGTQVHDARLAAAMQVHAVKHILTFNTRDFARFTSIEAIHPSQIAKP